MPSIRSNPPSIRSSYVREVRSSAEKPAQAQQVARPAAEPRAAEPSWRDGFDDLKNYKPEGMPSLDGKNKPSTGYGSTMDLKQLGGPNNVGGSLTVKDDGSVTADFKVKAGEKDSLGLGFDPEKGTGTVTYGTKVGPGEYKLQYGTDGKWQGEMQTPIGMVAGVPVTVQLKAGSDMAQVGLGAELETGIANAGANANLRWQQGDGLDFNGKLEGGLKLTDLLKLQASGDLNVDFDTGQFTIKAGAEARAGSLQANPEVSWQGQLWGEPPPVVGGAMQRGWGPATPPQTGLPDMTASGMRVGGAMLDQYGDFGQGPTLVRGGALEQPYVLLPGDAPAPTPVGNMMLGGAASGLPLGTPEELTPYAFGDLGATDVTPPDFTPRSAFQTGAETTLPGLSFDLGAPAVEPSEPAFTDTVGLTEGGAWEPSTAYNPLNVPDTSMTSLDDSGLEESLLSLDTDQSPMW